MKQLNSATLIAGMGNRKIPTVRSSSMYAAKAATQHEKIHNQYRIFNNNT
ncbi:MAG: hypothetical protein ABIR19_07780 [Ginsengibacter sp.]